MAEPFWEKAYADLKTSTFGEPSVEVRDIVSELQPGAQVLDLGCGEGRNALFLAACGFDVTAVNISESGIRKVNALAQEKDLKVHAEVCDMRDYGFPHPFDLIMSHGCLHLVERESWQRLIPLFKANTKPGGVNIVVVFTDSIPPPPDLEDFCIGLFQDGEVFSMYADWDIILQRSYTRKDQHPGSPPHTHPINKLVAKKPSNEAAAGDA